MEVTLWTKCVFEFIGTLVLVLMGDGVCAATTLERSKAKGAGWIVITLAWGFAVMAGVFIAGPYSGAHLNPAVSEVSAEPVLYIFITETITKLRQPILTGFSALSAPCPPSTISP